MPRFLQDLPEPRHQRVRETLGSQTHGDGSGTAGKVGGATLRYAVLEPWLLAAIWARRHNVSPYDAGYLALAELYDVPLVTLDERLARAAVRESMRVEDLRAYLHGVGP